MTGPVYSLADKRVWIAGHRGMVGAALVRRLQREGCEIVTIDRKDLDLRNQAAVNAWMAGMRPHAIFLAAATVGGIGANAARPAEFLYDNLLIQANIVDAAYRNGCEKLLILGSSCIYPRLATQPMTEEALLTGPLEPTNQWYALAKIAGIKLGAAYREQYGCDFISAMPTNLYGPGDNYDLESSHVVPALIRKIHEAKEAGDRLVGVWGSGRPLREFMYADDCADALVFLMQTYSGAEHVNVGTGEEISIAGLAETIAGIVGYDGLFAYDRRKPDGTPRKLMDSSRLRALGWSPGYDLADGLKLAYDDFLASGAAMPDAAEQGIGALA